MKHTIPPIALAFGALLTACAPSAPLPVTAMAPAWFQLDDKAPESDELTGYVLRAGRIGTGTGNGTGAGTGGHGDRSRVRIELPPEAFAEGPYAVDGASLVLFGHNDGARSALEVVDADTGARRVLVESPMVLRRALLDVDGDALYVLVLDQETRAELGVYRFSLASSLARPHTLDEGQIVLPGMAREKEGLELYGPTFATLFAIDRASGALVVQSCGEILCRARILDAASGDVIVRDEIGQGEMLGVVDGTLFTYEAGNGWPCQVYAIDVVTGAARSIARAYGAVVRDVEGELIFESGDEPGLLLARSLTRLDEEPRMLGIFDVTAGGDGDDALHPVLDPSRSLAGVELPPGLVAIGGDGRVARVGDDASPDPLFVRLEDGALFQAAYAPEMQ